MIDIDIKYQSPPAEFGHRAKRSMEFLTVDEGKPGHLTGHRRRKPNKRQRDKNAKNAPITQQERACEFRSMRTEMMGGVRDSHQAGPKHFRGTTKRRYQ